MKEKEEKRKASIPVYKDSLSDDMLREKPSMGLKTEGKGLENYRLPHVKKITNFITK